MGGLETMVLRTIRDADLRNKIVLMRVDFNVPIGKPDKSKGEITDDFRIQAALPTIRYILDDQKAKQLHLATHLDPWEDIPATTMDSRLSTVKIAARLSRLLGEEVATTEDCIVDPNAFPQARVVMRQNLRFRDAEKSKKDSERLEFARQLAQGIDAYVNDAFGTCHRKHTSVYDLAKQFKDPNAGFLIEKEVKYLTQVRDNPEMPFYVVMGGSKVSDKIKVINSLAPKVTAILIGGKMAIAFADVAYEGIGDDERELAKELVKQHGIYDPATGKGKLVLPIDYVAEDRTRVSADAIPKGINLYDVGPKTTLGWKRLMSGAKTLFGNLVVGYAEREPFDRGTMELINFFAGSEALTVIGGGDSVKMVMKSGQYERILKHGHVSTGGGASLEFLEGKQLPGLEPLYI